MINEKISSNGPIMSRIILGGWRWNDRSFNLAEQQKLIGTALDLNITTFDHADIYGNYNCQPIFGGILKADPSLRKKVEIITKCGIKPISNKFKQRKIGFYDTSTGHIIKSAENSLKSLNTEYVDALLIHRSDPLMHPDEMAEAFYQLKNEGKVLHFGVSNFSNEQYSMLQSRLDFELITNQVEISLTYWKPLFDGTLDYLLQHKISPMAWSPFGGGKIFGNISLMEKLNPLLEKYNCKLSTLLIAWLIKLPSKVFPVVGTMKSERLKPIVDGLSLKIERQDWFLMLKHVRGYDVP